MLSFAKTAEEWLKMVDSEGKDVIWQLTRRRIWAISVLPLFTDSGLAIGNDKKTFCAYINTDCESKNSFRAL